MDNGTRWDPRHLPAFGPPVPPSFKLRVKGLLLLLLAIHPSGFVPQAQGYRWSWSEDAPVTLVLDGHHTEHALRFIRLKNIGSRLVIILYKYLSILDIGSWDLVHKT